MTTGHAAPERSVGDHLQFEAGGQTRRFGWTGPWPPPEYLALVFGGATGQATATEWTDDLLDRIRESPGGGQVTVVRCVRVSHSGLPPQEAGSHVARGALYKPADTDEG